MAIAPLIILLLVLGFFALVRPPGERQTHRPATLQRALRGVGIAVVVFLGLYLAVVLMLLWGHAHGAF